MNASLKLILVASLAAFPARNIAHGFQSHIPRTPTQNRSHGHEARARTGRGKTCLRVVRRPLRPASTEKKRAERKAIIQSRQHEALQDPSLLTDLSFSACHVHPSSQRALVEDMGLRTMTEVQAKTFAGANLGQDVLARARTGKLVDDYCFCHLDFRFCVDEAHFMFSLEQAQARPWPFWCR